MRHPADPRRPKRVKVVVEALEREALQVDEIPGHLQADDMRVSIALDDAAGKAFDEDRADRAFLAAPGDQLAVGDFFLALDEVLDQLLLAIAQRIAETAEQEAAGARIALQFTRDCVRQRDRPLTRLSPDWIDQARSKRPSGYQECGACPAPCAANDGVIVAVRTGTRGRIVRRPRTRYRRFSKNRSGRRTAGRRNSR